MSIEVTVFDLHSNQADPDPDMAKIKVSRQLLVLAKRAAAFMRTEGFHTMTRWWSLEYKFYALDEKEDATQETIIVDGKRYVPFEPEYQLDGPHLKIDFDGELHAIFPFRYGGGEMSCSLGDVDSLLATSKDIPDTD